MTDLTPWSLQKPNIVPEPIPLSISIRKEQCIIDEGTHRLKIKIQHGKAVLIELLHYGHGPLSDKLFEPITYLGVLERKWGGKRGIIIQI